MDYQLHLDKLAIFGDKLELDNRDKYIVVYAQHNVVAFIPIQYYKFKYCYTLGNTMIYDILGVNQC